MVTDFYHEPVLFQEVIDILSIRPEGIYVDATFGGGGHARGILNQLGADGRLIVLDQDMDAFANVPDDPRILFIHSNFRFLSDMLRVEGIRQVDGVLADLGVSSHQFDQAHRGFSYRMNGPLDMRMNAEAKQTAADILKAADEKELTILFSAYGEVRNAKTLARHIVSRRQTASLREINDLIHLIAPVIMGNRNKYLAQVFQALRIAVNGELEVLKTFLQEANEVLAPGGIMAVISFHSLEDRLIKNYFRYGNFEGELIKDKFGRSRPLFELINKKPITATAAELERNSRARSAKLRAAKKIAAHDR